MKNIRTSQNYDWKADKGEISLLPSKTVPNEALSIAEILQRFTQGYEAPRKQSYYSNTEDFEDIDPTRSPDFDLADAHEEMTALNARIRRAQTEKPKPKEAAETEEGVKPDEV